jgi:hypothetical protein
LKKLDANVTPAFLVHYFQEEGEHVPFQEKTEMEKKYFMKTSSGNIDVELENLGGSLNEVE